MASGRGHPTRRPPRPTTAGGPPARAAALERVADATAIVLAHGPLQPKIAATLTDFVYRHGGRIVYHEQFVDRERQHYFTRLEWELGGFALPREGIAPLFSEAVAAPFGLGWSLHFSDDVPRIAVFVSTLGYCLYDIVARWRSGEWGIDIPIVISNRPKLEEEVRRSGIAFHCVPVTAETKADQERRQLALLRGSRVELVVLARYMQVLSPAFVSAYPERIINIHHAFLPAFPGAKPYQAAYRRGVKLIGATSHYVTADLDAGPIIAQDVVPVSHATSVEDMLRLGRDLEKTVLARAVWAHLQRKILVHDGRTVVFP